MKLSALLLIAMICLCSSCYADTVKGDIDKVNIKTYEIVVNGSTVNIAKATVFTENDMGITKNVIIRDVKDHRGERAVCYGSVEKDNVFHAYRVKIIEGHK